MHTPVVQQRPVMYVLVAVVEASSQAGAQQLLGLWWATKKQLGSSSQQRQLDTSWLTGKAIDQRPQRVRGACTTNN